MLRPVTIRTTTPPAGRPAAGRRQRGQPSPLPACRRPRTRPPPAAISRSVTSAISSAAFASTSTAIGIATRTAIPSANVSLWDDPPRGRVEAPRHHRRTRRDHADPPGGRRPLPQPQADPGQQRAVSDRYQHRIRRHVDQDLVERCRRSPGYWAGSAPSWKERQPLRPGRGLDPGGLGLVQVGVRPPSARRPGRAAGASFAALARSGTKHHGVTVPYRGRGPGGGGAGGCRSRR